jgi:hypothetical protein
MYSLSKYLYIGFGSTKFRSPAEFEDHLLWLASDQSTHCLCKYCSKESTPRRRMQSKRPTQSTQSTPQGQAPQKSSSDQVEEDERESHEVTSFSLPVTTSKSKVQLPSDANHSSRNGEIVWIKTSLVLSETYLEELRKSKVKIEHWPGYVIERQKFSQVVNNVSSGPIVDNLYYKVQPLNIAGTQKASEEQIAPWILLSSESLAEKIYKMRDSNRRTSSPTLMRIINLFCSACDTARRISKTYTPLDSYKYILPPLSLSKIEDSNERRLLQEMENYMHYKTLYFGSEILKEDDYVRMNDVESKGDNIRIFKINTIYKNFDNKILFNGDIYLKASTKGDKISWSKLNDEDKEYFIELKEISGRYYDEFPHISKSMEVNEAVSFRERKKLIEGETDKSESSPSQPISRKKTAKHSMYFDKIPNTPPAKKFKVDQKLKKQAETQNENTTSQRAKQDVQQEEDNHTNDNELDHMDVDVIEVQRKVDPIIISPTIPFLDEFDDEISEKESNLFEMLSNNLENSHLTAK